LSGRCLRGSNPRVGAPHNGATSPWCGAGNSPVAGEANSANQVKKYGESKPKLG